MKITVNPQTGAMEFDATPEEAVALMSLQAQVKDAQEQVAENAEVAAAADSAGLTQANYLVWDYLVQHENVDAGITVTAVARHLRITPAAASSRLGHLVEQGFAERISRGRYKAVCP